MNKYKCLRCGHKWIPRVEHKPALCPRCRSPYWDKPYVNKAKAHRRQVWENA